MSVRVRFAHRLMLLVPVLVVATACSHGGRPPIAGLCAKSRAVALGKAPHEDLRGDVDGDGAPDRIALVRLRGGRARCGAFLVVRTESSTLARPLATDVGPPVPVLNGLARIGSASRLRIVITTVEGASTAFAHVFAVDGSRILELPIRGPDAGGFAYWGSVTHYGGVDCVKDRPGLILEETFSSLASSRQQLYRNYYRLQGGRFELARKEVIKRITRALRRSSRGEEPFPSCMRVRAAS